MDVLQNRAFSSAEALRFGWTTTCANLRPLLVIGLTGAFLGLLQQALNRPPPSVGAPILSLALQLLEAALFMGLLRASLQLSDGRAVDLSRPQELLANFFGYLLTALLLSLIVVGGLALLIVPGVLWAVRFGYAPLLAIDTNCDPVQALRESSRLTAGSRGSLFQFGLLAAGINLLGALAFGVGLLVTLPTTLIAAAQILRQLQAHAGRTGSEPSAPAHSHLTGGGAPA